MQEIINLAKAGKRNKVLSHKEFVNTVKGKLPENFTYEKCSDDAKQRWLNIIEANKNKKTT